MSEKLVWSSAFRRQCAEPTFRQDSKCQAPVQTRSCRKRSDCLRDLALKTLAVRHGFEPTFRAFSPLPMIASSCVFIAFQYTHTINVCNHYMCIFGKRREEKRVQIVCKKGGCANFVQIKLASESVQTCAKILARRGRLSSASLRKFSV
jgi:hypothetical protein